MDISGGHQTRAKQLKIQKFHAAKNPKSDKAYYMVEMQEVSCFIFNLKNFADFSIQLKRKFKSSLQFH